MSSIITSDGGVGRLVREATRSGHDGELRLSRDGIVGRVFLVRGRVAWAHTDGRHGTLVDRLVERCGLSRARLAELVIQCRSSGANLGERLVELGIVEPATLRRVLLDHIRTQLEALRASHGPLTAVFVPRRRAYSGRFTFAPDEVVSADGPIDSTVQAALRWVHTAWDRAVGCFSEPVAVGVRESGRVPYLTRLANSLSPPARAEVERLIDRRASGTDALEHHLSWGSDDLVYYECPMPGGARRALLAARNVSPGLLVARSTQLLLETPWAG